MGKMTTYSLLALDIDGTLFNSQKEITPRTHQVLLEAQKRGVRIALVSGRPTYGMAPMANALQLDNYGGFVLSYNGSEIVNWKTKETLYAQTLPPELLPFLYQCAKKYNLPIVTYHNEQVITEHPQDTFVQKQALLRVMKMHPVDNFLQVITFPVYKCLIAGEPERLIQVEEEMSRQLQGQMDAYRSEPHFLELVPMNVDKGTALKRLLQLIGLSAAEAMACGDGFNDIPMIKVAGWGVAMANAHAIVMDAANYITASNDEEGVALAVEKFLL